MPSTTISRWLRTGARDPAMTSRVLGVFYLAGALLVLVSILLPHPEGANDFGLFGISAVAAAVGSASLIWARRARTWSVHAVLAAGTGLISLCVYFVGVASGIYWGMFIWVVLVAGSFFSVRAVVAHVGWVIISWGSVLAVVEEPSGFSPITRWTLTSFILAIAAVVMSEIVAGRKLIEEELGSAREELEALAHQDPLTGVANRRLFEQELVREFAQAKRRDASLSIVALDLDRFKEFNDEHGHLAGDRLLKSAANLWSEALRAGDLLARLGGDEFIALLPDCPPAEAKQVAKRLCDALPLDSLECACSSGVAVWNGNETAEDLLLRADRALYETKRANRASLPEGELL